MPLTTRFPRVIHHCQIAANDGLYHTLPLGCLASWLKELKSKNFPLPKAHRQNARTITHQIFSSHTAIQRRQRGCSTRDAENTAKWEMKQTTQGVISAINNNHHDCCQNSAIIRTWVMIQVPRGGTLCTTCVQKLGAAVNPPNTLLSP